MAHGAPYYRGSTAGGAPVPVRRVTPGSTEGLGSLFTTRSFQVDPTHTGYAQDAAHGPLHPQGTAGSAFIQPGIAAALAPAGRHAERYG